MGVIEEQKIRFGNNIRAVRINQRMNQSEVAEKADLALHTVCRAESGIVNMDSMLRICDALGVSVGDMFGEPITPLYSDKFIGKWRQKRIDGR